MPDSGNTTEKHGKGYVEHGDMPRFGIILWDAFDSDEFRGLNGETALRVYTMFCLMASGRGDQTCWPRQRVIAEILGVHRTTVNRAIDQLEEAGLIVRSKVWRGHRQLTKYTLTLPPSKRE